MIEFVGLSHTFASRRASRPALTSINLHVNDGEFVVLLGPSGCGKSTLLHLTAGLLQPTAGRVLVDGKPSADCRDAKTFALAPQQPALLPWRTVRENARLLLDVNPQADEVDHVDALLSEVGLTDAADAYPNQLSGGMQQRVALVRAFALGAPVLLLDEPFAALDELTRSDMRHLLARLWTAHQSTALFVTHSVAEAVLLADRVVVLSGSPGHVVAEVPITLPRPRTDEVEDTDAFDHHVRELRAILREVRAA